ncbi:ubiquitin-conjugating enzyme E2 T [Histomonas meleagridis]|uniref:ubiquitin-conjugating enzyme E2 T n=1 Tax=Histomonas meleagridis TaxID=135588 RepID=UPI0035598ED5|nr:ubiquitin-conjugating enzyme E2 T [Histomonas meleagridis]KAH0800349.1 ubiquitin-conjugating enzyme E2 T [Histomonas meleagridis]
MQGTTNRGLLRVQKELQRMNVDPPHGIGMWPVNERLDQLEALIEGPEDSPFEGGEFRLSISIPETYPNTPPVIKFKTKIYHPNIDSSGRICLDSLKPEPNGSWKPSINLAMVLTQIRLLMTNPNVADPLDTKIAEQYQQSKELYDKEAKRYTETYAKPIATTLEEDVSESSEEE